MLRLFWVPLLTLSVGNAFACSCDDSSIDENVRSASTILVGKVLNQKTVQTKSLLWAVYSIKIEKALKGKITTNIVSVWTSSRSASCGVVFADGWKIIVYGSQHYRPIKNELDPNDKFIYTNLCTRSGKYLQSEEKGIRLALG